MTATHDNHNVSMEKKVIIKNAVDILSRDMSLSNCLKCLDYYVLVEFSREIQEKLILLLVVALSKNNKIMHKFFVNIISFLMHKY